MAVPGITIPADIPSLDAGKIVDASDLNILVDNINFLMAKPLCVLAASVGNRSISTSTNTTAVQWDVAKFDTSGMWNSATPTVVTVVVPGWYKVRYSIVVNNSAGVAINGYMSQIGGPVPGNFLGSGIVTSNPLSPGAGLGASGLWPFYLYPGNQLQLWVQASSSGQSTSVSPGATEMSLEWVSF